MECCQLPDGKIMAMVPPQYEGDPWISLAHVKERGPRSSISVSEFFLSIFVNFFIVVKKGPLDDGTWSGNYYMMVWLLLREDYLPTHPLACLLGQLALRYLRHVKVEYTEVWNIYPCVTLA